MIGIPIPWKELSHDIHMYSNTRLNSRQTVSLNDATENMRGCPNKKNCSSM